jgi:hypothetical protein
MQEPWFMNRGDGSATLLISMHIEQKQLATKVAADCGVSERTVRKWLTRLQAGGERLDPPLPVVRHQRQRPGRLVHIDTKKLGKLPPPAERPQRSPAACRRRGIATDQPACHEQPAW